MGLIIDFQRQDMMRQVVLALIPGVLGSVYFFGWIALVILLVSIISCTLTEWVFVRKSGGKVSEAVFVTAFLFALTLPPTIPLYMVVLGSAFGIVFGKMAFGGFGANIFNPALVGRAFLYITFPVHMTNKWIPAADFSDFPGGFLSWKFTGTNNTIEAITSATPLSAFREHAANLPDYLQLFMGNINGNVEILGETILLGGGSLGETSALLLFIGGCYLLVKKIASWQIVVSFFISFLITSFFLHSITPILTPNPLYGLLTGGLVLGGFFMATDPISATRTNSGRFIYGSLIGLLTVLIRSYSLFYGGVMFAILLGNTFAPLIDYAVKQRETKKT